MQVWLLTLKRCHPNNHACENINLINYLYHCINKHCLLPVIHMIRSIMIAYRIISNHFISLRIIRWRQKFHVRAWYIKLPHGHGQKLSWTWINTMTHDHYWHQCHHLWHTVRINVKHACRNNARNHDRFLNPCSEPLEPSSQYKMWNPEPTGQACRNLANLAAINLEPHEVEGVSAKGVEAVTKLT